ncbi:MAG: carboxypeptidase regulatory-like domain-containing protein [Gemmatimonadales bacterium]
MPQHRVFGRFCATAFAASAMISLALAGPLRAQSFRGTLETTAHGQPVAGAIVLLEDTLHAIQARSRSDDRGRFVLRPAAAGRFSLRVQRIGVRPYESAPFELKADTTAVIALNELPFSLPQVTSSAASVCRARSLASAATRQLWEDVRTVLIATSLTYAEQRNRFSVAEVRRVYGTHPAALRSVSLLEQAVTGVQPWTSFAPDILAEHGYVAFARDRLTFVSPDLDVLLSRSFENTHCFEPTLAHEGGLVGLSFDPGKSLKNNTDIAGTFWLDSASHELRRLTFHHTGLPTIIGDSTGESTVRFAMFASDEWFIPEWTIRAPIPELPRGPRMPVIEQLRLFGDVVTGRDSRQFLWGLAAVKEQRGNVLAVHRAGPASDTRAVWTGATGAVRVAVTNEPWRGDASTPLAGAEIELVGSTHQQATDSAGVVTFDGLTTGDYRLSVSTLAYTLFAEQPVVLDVHVDAGAVTQAAADLKPLKELRFERCRDTLEYVIAGTVVRDGMPVPSAHLAVYEPSFVDGVRIGTLNASKVDGRFVICTRRAGTANSFEVRANDVKGLEGTGIVRFAKGEHLRAIDLLLGPLKEAKAP